MQLHIRVLAGHLGPGAGSHVYNRELIKRLARRGHRVSAVCFDGADTVATCADVTSLPQRGYDRAPLLWRLAASLEYRHAASSLRRLLKQVPDVVIAAEHLFIVPHARRFPAAPIVYLPHSLLVRHEIDGYQLPAPMHRNATKVYQGIQRWGLAQAAATVRFTRMACRVLQEAYPDVIVKRFVVNPMGIDLPPDPRPAANVQTVRLLYVGRLVPVKRVDLIIDALAASPYKNWTLDIVGDGPLRESLERRAREADLSQRVHFRGFCDTVDQWYRRADLLLLTSKSENSPLVLLEAMSYGVACLGMLDDGATTFNANREIIEHERTGILVDGERGLQEQLNSVLSNPGRLNRLGDLARQEAATRWTWDAHLVRYEVLFDELKSVAHASRSRLPPPRELSS